MHNHLPHLVILLFVVRETNPPDEVSTQEDGKDNPEGEEHLTVKQSPAICKVCHREELEGKGEFDETERDLHHVHPVATLRHGIEPLREEGKEREGQCQGNGKAEHADDGTHDAGCDHLHQEKPDDGTCAGETDQHERECHQEDAEQSCGAVGFVIDSGIPLGRQGDFEAPNEGDTENEQHEEEENVEHGIGCQIVQGRCSEDGCDGKSERHIDDDDAHAIENGVTDAPTLGCRFLLGSGVLGRSPLEEEGHSHGDDGPHTRSDQGNQTAQQSQEKDLPEGSVGGVAVATLIEYRKLVDDGCPDGRRCRDRGNDRVCADHIGRKNTHRSLFWCISLCLLLLSIGGEFHLSTHIEIH